MVHGEGLEERKDGVVVEEDLEHFFLAVHEGLVNPQKILSRAANFDCCKGRV